jgi:hypothetical protein
MAEKSGASLMDWASLQLWAEDEEKRIHTCLVEALQQLVVSQSVRPENGELKISGKLRPYLYRTKKKLKLAWTLHCEASSFENEESEKPYGHPDIRFSSNTPGDDQYDYDVECKLVRVKRQGKDHDYCKYYVTNGVKRFQDGIYAQSLPSMGAMIGYVQEGEFTFLLGLVNDESRKNNFDEIILSDSFSEQAVTVLTQQLRRSANMCTLTHLWADLR